MHGITVTVTVTVHNSSLIPPAGLSSSEDVATTYSFIFTEYDQDPKVLSSSYEGLKPPKKV